MYYSYHPTKVFSSSSRLFELMQVGVQLLRQSSRALVGDTPNRRLLVVVLLGLFGAASEGNVERSCHAVCSGHGRCGWSLSTVSGGVSMYVHTVEPEHFMETTF